MHNAVRGSRPTENEAALIRSHRHVGTSSFHIEILSWLGSCFSVRTLPSAVVYRVEGLSSPSSLAKLTTLWNLIVHYEEGADGPQRFLNSDGDSSFHDPACFPTLVGRFIGATRRVLHSPRFFEPCLNLGGFIMGSMRLPQSRCVVRSLIAQGGSAASNGS